MDSRYTASAFLDRNGQYAKDPELVHTVRFYLGAGCEHEDLSADTFHKWPPADIAAAKLLPGRPECM